MVCCEYIRCCEQIKYNGIWNKPLLIYDEGLVDILYTR